MRFNSALFFRILVMLVMVALEVLILLGIARWFGENAAWIETILHLLSLFVVLGIIKNSRHLSSDMIWILFIILFPVPGTAVYCFLGADMLLSRTFRNIMLTTAEAKKYYRQDPDILKEMEVYYPYHQGQFRYISRSAGFPFYRNTGFDYYSLGDTGWPVMLEEMRKAERFIFLEYFIIEEGQMWNSMLEILEQKAKEGLDVRVMYDDLGSFMTLSPRYAKKLEEKGIKCVTFNRINPILGIIMNHRDHRKIMVIDGRTAFSGGVNLADEYINRVNKFGHWKDNVIRIKGEAVWSYTVMFLTHWNALRREDTDYAVFRCEQEEKETFDGYIAPYGEMPLDNEIVAQNIYAGILNQAGEYVYIMTPYLIIDTELINDLILCARHGVDVRIITPGIPDKKLVWSITRSYYRQLIEGGVKVYEYTPGFVHGKVFVSDDVVATVGTVNLDYRSLYLHFENGTMLYGSKKVLDVKQDMEQTLKQCRQVSLPDCSYGILKEFWLGVLRIFAPLM